MKNTTQTPDQFAKATEDVFSQLDDLKTGQVVLSQKLLTVRDKLDQQELARVTKKYGKDSPRALELQARIAYNRAFMPVVETHLEQLKRKTDPLPATSWRVYGYVTDGNGNTVPKVTVLLADEKGTPQRNLPYGCSDDNGYYSITLDKDQLPDTKTGYLLVAYAPGSKDPGITSREPLLPAAGKQDYRDIVLNVNNCAPPPDDQDSGRG